MSDLITRAYPVPLPVASEPDRGADWSNPSNINFGGTTVWSLPLASSTENQE